MPEVRSTLGIRDDEYEEMLEWSEHRCWICGQEEQVNGRRLACDHDHQTGAFRGLLCTSCNRRLGGTVDPVWLRRAADYLTKARAAFADSCPKCLIATAPAAIDEVRGQYTQFRYEHCETRWTCTWKTAGVPFRWQFCGLPVP